MWSRKSSAILASVAHIESKKFSLAQQDFKTVKPGNKANVQAVLKLLKFWQNITAKREIIGLMNWKQ